MGRPSKYPEEFRREAVELARSSDRSVAETARVLGISDGTLGNWINVAKAQERREADPAALSDSERDELTRLRRETAQLRTDNEILRKAAAYFARETHR